MKMRSAILFLVITFVAYGEETASEGSDDVTSADVDSTTTLPIRVPSEQRDLLEKALIAKKKRKDNFDRFNMRYLNNAAHDDAKRSADYKHRDRDYFTRKSKKHRTLLPPPKERKPNIILILTDDQDVELGSLNFMPRTLRLLRDGGAEFRHAYVTTPMCCPSRSSLLTGMYVHNHNVFTNNENCSSQAWQRTHETRTFATYLSNAGYRTGYFGKYLNKYNGSYVPAGWREWGGLIMNSRYYNYSINLNGRRVRHGHDYQRDYYTDLIANDSVSFLRQSKQYFSRKPVMLVLSFPAPHGPEDSAPQFANMFFNVTTHHTPAYDFAPNPDKQWILQVTNRMHRIHKKFTDLLMTKRLQTLQSVDIAVERIYQELKHIGELENTYIVYTSDHGYHLGQFGLVKGKSFPFEFDVRVPFLVRGPGIQPGTIVEDIVLNLDLAPTFLDMAGVETPPHMDGRSFLKLLHPPRTGRRPRWPDTFLIESSGRRDIPDQLRTKRPRPLDVPMPEVSDVSDNLTESGSGQEESSEMDHTDDEDESNIPDPPFPTRTHDDLAHDNKIPGVVAKPGLMVEECPRPELQMPCRVGQKWFCMQDGVRWRRHKCRLHTCTCFTQQGYMYTRPPIPGDELRMDDSLLHVLHSRRRRDINQAQDHIEDIVEDLDAELEEAEDTEIALQNSTLWQCSVTSQGIVNCSDVVYSDYQTWRQTRDRTEAKIRLLKNQLIALKELRKHLRDKKPLASWNESHTTESVSTQDIFTTDKELPATATAEPTESYSTNQGPSDVTTEKSEHAWENRIDRMPVRSDQDTCFCTSDHGFFRRDDLIKDVAREARRRLKEEKLRKKERKSKKKAKMEKECLSEKMNCFNHDNEHWRTPPLWSEGPFCFCMNANNNTYSCLRTINATHNFLYCEFVTGFVTFYNIRIDPFEQLNRIGSLSEDEKRQLSEQLAELKSCRGTKECTVGSQTKLFLAKASGFIGCAIQYGCIAHCTFEYIADFVFCLGPSMEPTINSHDIILTEHISTRFHRFERGDIVIARSPSNPNLNICKRVTALPGDRVKGFFGLVVPRGHVWLEGDNRGNSSDSRCYGPVPQGLIRGRALCRVWPLPDIKIFRNDDYKHLRR